MRWYRGSLVALSTLAVLALALVWPALARGEAWWGAKWAVVAGPLGAHPSTADTLGWLARAAWCGALAAALLSVPYVVWRMTLGADARVPRLGLPTIAPLALGPRGWRTPLRDAPGVLRGAALVLAVLALGRPQSVLRGENEEEKGIDIVLVLDLSGSMAAVMDAPAADLVPGIGHSRGATGRRASTSPRTCSSTSSGGGRPTASASSSSPSRPSSSRRRRSTTGSSRRSSRASSSASSTAARPPSATRSGTAVARMRRSNARSKAVVLLTDGDSNEGVISPEYSAHLAQKEGVRVYTVQIGNGDDVDVQTGTDLFGQPVYARKHFPVNPELLRAMSHETGGEAFIATDKSGLEKSMHSILDHLEKTKFESQASTMEDLFPFLLVPAVVLIALEALVRLALVRRFP